MIILLFVQSPVHQAFHAAARWAHQPLGSGCLCVVGGGAQVVSWDPTSSLKMSPNTWRVLLILFIVIRFRRILVLISHSQDFLNGVCTNIINLHQRKLKYYTVRTLVETTAGAGCFLFFLFNGNILAASASLWISLKTNLEFTFLYVNP